MKETFGERFARLRKARGLTQEALAEKVGVSGQAVSKWENDISFPDITILPQLSDILGVSLDKLLGKEEDNSVAVVPEEERKDFSKMVLKIRVNSAEGDKVNIKMPMPLVKAGIKLGMKVEGASALQDVDFNEIISLVEQGVVGKIMDIESADGDIVSIIVE